MITRIDQAMNRFYQKSDGSIWWWQFGTFTKTRWYLFNLIPIWQCSHSYEDKPFHSVWN